jgi:phage-related minor tail protein
MLQLAQSGKFSGETLQQAAQAAVNLAALTGESIDSTTDKIIKLADSPTATLVKLNQQYHFLTEAVYKHVSALEDQGRVTDALRVGVEFFADVHEQRVKEAEARAGALERVWKGLREVIANTWNDIKDIGRTDAEHRLEVAKRALGDAYSRAQAGSRPFDASRYQAEIDAAQKAVDADQKAAKAKAATQAANDARVADADKKRAADKKQAEEDARNWSQRAIGDLSKQEKLEEKIKQIRAEGARLNKTDAEIKAQEAQARARYAESLPKGRAAATGKKTDAQQAEEAAQREIANLTKQAALLGQLEDGERKVSHEAQARYDIANGIYRLASAGTQQQLIAAAKLKDTEEARRDAAEKQKRAFEDAERDYERLRKSLETPVEAAAEEVTAKIDTLNRAMANGAVTADEYKDALKRIFEQSYQKAPELPGQFQPAGGPLGDGIELAQYSAALQKWRDDETAANDDRYARWEISETAHQERMAAIRREYDGKNQQLSQANSQFMLGTASSLFGSLAEIARSGAGEQSKAYRALFALSQGFAVAQALIAVYQNAAEASKQAGGWPYNIPIIAGAIAQGLGIVAQIRSVQPGGYAEGGYTGPGGKYQPAGIVHKGEGVLSQKDMHALGGPSGFYALRHAIHNGYAEGGVVHAPDYDQGSTGIRLNAPQAPATQLKNNMRLYNLFDIDALAQKLAMHPKMEEKIITIAGENGNTIRASWGW